MEGLERLFRQMRPTTRPRRCGSLPRSDDGSLLKRIAFPPFICELTSPTADVIAVQLGPTEGIRNSEATRTINDPNFWIPWFCGNCLTLCGVNMGMRLTNGAGQGGSDLFIVASIAPSVG